MAWRGFRNVDGASDVGAAHAWLEGGGRPAGDAPVQECGVGLVELRRIGGRLAFRAPPLVRSGPLSDDERRHFTTVLDLDDERVLDAAWVDNGPAGDSVIEDPGTGSLNASVARWLIETGRVRPPYVACQGQVIGRAGRVQIHQDAEGDVWVGGATSTVTRGQIDC